MTSILRWVACGAVALAVCLAQPASMAARQTLPSRLSDAEYWRLVKEISEPNGYFNSDNLVSNEDTYQHVIPELMTTVRPGGVYVGVGPDQNFTYISAVQPRMAFIPDIRRGNLLVQLMYKAIFELSSDRADFVARLFSRARMVPTTPAAGAEEILDAAALAKVDRGLYDRNLKAIGELLTVRHGFVLGADDLSGIAFAYSNFFAAGPALAFVSNGGGGGRSRYPTWEELQTATDVNGVNHGYLSTEARFQAIKLMEERNLIVPVVGNLAGPKALRRIGAYVRERGATVTTFYVSNVENYLFQDRLWDDFRANVATLPLDASSTFIRSCFNSCSTPGGPRAVSLLDSMSGLLTEAAAGRIRSYWDVLNHSRRPARP